MLYPIELLGQMTATRPGALRRTACMLTAEVGFVMSSVGFLNVGRSLARSRRLHPANPGIDGRSCKMHYPKMPSLQFATKPLFRHQLTH